MKYIKYIRFYILNVKSDVFYHLQIFCGETGLWTFLHKIPMNQRFNSVQFFKCNDLVTENCLFVSLIDFRLSKLYHYITKVHFLLIVPNHSLILCFTLFYNHFWKPLLHYFLEEAISNCSYIHINNYFLELGYKKTLLVELIMQIIYKNNDRKVRYLDSKCFGIFFLIKGIKTYNGMLYVHTQTKKRSGSTTHRYQPTSRLLAPISSTASADVPCFVLIW